MANQIRSKGYNAIFTEKCSLTIIILKDQKDRSCEDRVVDSWIDFHLMQMNSFTDCVNKADTTYLACIKNENVIFKCPEEN